MPEGHTIHRAAIDHRRILAGQSLIVSSPQGRFSEGALLLTGQLCGSIEAFGKHLLYEFNNGLTLHVHLGLFGRIRKSKLPIPEPKGAVRVRLMSETHLVDISGPTICRVLDHDNVTKLLNRIGPDVLRVDSKPDLAFRKITRSNTPIGRLIMDQSVMAGIGNIYRSEILWRQAIHPETPGNAITRQAFDRIWEDAKTLLAVGVKKNAIITVDRIQTSRKGYRRNFNIFGEDKCPTCKGSIRRFTINGRRAYVCDACQPIQTTMQ